MTKLDGDVHDPRDPGPHRTQWRWQRIGQAGLVGVMLVGASGFMGAGPLADATEGLGKGAWIHYQRFARAQANQELVVHLPQAGGEVRVWLGRGVLEANQVTQIAPAPAGQEVAPDGAVYRFQAAPGGGDVVFVLRARRRGPVTLDVQVGDTPPVHLPQWVWP